MADKKISQLTGATTPLAGTEVLPIVQSGATKKTTVQSITDRLNLGTMAQQDADNVNIDGGSMDGVTVGDTTPAPGTFSNVNVKGTTNTTEELGRFSNNAGTNELVVEQQGSSGYAFKSSVDLRLYADYDNDTSAAGSNIRMYTDAVQRVIIAGDTGDVTLDTGNLVIGTAGKGIDFSADGQAAGMTSELLDDYEEGTWTPVATTNSGAFTTVNAEGTYTKIGNMVVACFTIYIVDKGTAANYLGFSGLPFTSANENSLGSGSVRNGFDGTQWSLTVTKNTTSVFSSKYDGTVAVVDNDSWSGCVVYRTA